MSYESKLEKFDRPSLGKHPKRPARAFLNWLKEFPATPLPIDGVKYDFLFDRYLADRCNHVGWEYGCRVLKCSDLEGEFLVI